MRAPHLAASARHVAVGLGDLEVLDPVLQVLRPSEAEHKRVTAGAEGSDEAARTWLGLGLGLGLGWLRSNVRLRV